MGNTTGDKMFTAKEIAEIMGVTRQAIETRVKKEKWHYIKEAGKGRGGETKKYPISSLPADFQDAYIYKEGDDVQKMTLLPALKPSATAIMINKYNGFDELFNKSMVEIAFAPSEVYDPATAIRETDMTAHLQDHDHSTRS